VAYHVVLVRISARLYDEAEGQGSRSQAVRASPLPKSHVVPVAMSAEGEMRKERKMILQMSFVTRE
jgi:hypothetical protein